MKNQHQLMINVGRKFEPTLKKLSKKARIIAPCAWESATFLANQVSGIISLHLIKIQVGTSPGALRAGAGDNASAIRTAAVASTKDRAHQARVAPASQRG